MDVQTSSPWALGRRPSGFHRNSPQAGSGPGRAAPRPESCLLTEEKQLPAQHSCLGRAWVPTPFENSPQTWKARGPCGGLRGGRGGQSGSLAPPVLSEWFTGSGWASVLNTQSSRESVSSSENRR